MNHLSFQQEGYLFVPALIDTKTYFTTIKKLAEWGRGNKNDAQVPGSIGFYKEPFFEKLLQFLLPTIEFHTGYELLKTYSYARCYHLGEELKPHTDRQACEITVSLTLGYEGSSWPIWILDKQKEKHSFTLEPGGALIFKGMELKHWREKNVYGNCAQVFLHYVDKNGPFANKADDRSEDITKY